MYDKEYKHDNVIRIADKPTFKYLTAITMKLEKYDTIILTAFGRNLERAFDIAQKAPTLFSVKVDKIETIEQPNGNGILHKGIRITITKIEEP